MKDFIYVNSKDGKMIFISTKQIIYIEKGNPDSAGSSILLSTGNELQVTQSFQEIIDRMGATIGN